MRFLSNTVACTNIWRFSKDKDIVETERGLSEDMVLIQRLKEETAKLRDELTVKTAELERLKGDAARPLLTCLRGLFLQASKKTDSSERSASL